MNNINKEEIERELSTFPGEWDTLLSGEKDKEYFKSLIEKVSLLYSIGEVYPPYKNVYNAFKLTELKDLKAVIVGQDPYYNLGQANGLSFSVNPGVKLPPSLLNIYKELNIEYGYPISKNGDLSSWARQGVLLLNASLTVESGLPNSHYSLGWQEFTDDVIKIIDEKVNRPIVYLLWGNFAYKKKDLIRNKKAFIIHTAHPSPLSANHGFFYSNCFKKCNEYLKANNIAEINFQIK